MNELVSIIIPVYNCENYVEACIESVRQQKYTNIEIILINDGSTDRSGEICEMIAQQDNRVVVLHQKNQGVAAVRNRGIESATGEYITFVDSDDKISVHYVEKLLEAMHQRKADILICDMCCYESELDSKGKIPNVKLDREQALEDLFMDRIQSYMWGKLFRKDIFAGIQLPVGMTFEDHYIMPQLFLKAKSVACIPDKLYYYYYDRPGNISGNSTIAHSLDLAKAQRHRYEIAKNIKFSKASDLLLKKAVYASVGVYLRILKSGVSGQYNTYLREIQNFFSRHTIDILKCKRISILRKAAVILCAVCSCRTGE